jgi:hypothetical protein
VAGSNNSGTAVQSAAFGTRKNFSDVTERVTELLHTRTDGFMVNAREMDMDPSPGKKMRLTILYASQGSALCVHHPTRKGHESPIVGGEGN